MRWALAFCTFQVWFVITLLVIVDYVIKVAIP